MEEEESKEFLGGQSFEFSWKREERHKRIQAISPSILLAKGEERHKIIQAVSPSILLAKGEVNEEEEQHKFLNNELFLEEKVLNKNSMKEICYA